MRSLLATPAPRDRTDRTCSAVRPRSRSLGAVLLGALVGALIGPLSGLAQAAPLEHTQTPVRRFGMLPTPYVTPFLRTRLVERTELGPHDWRTHDGEYAGLMYSCRGGFLDLDHVRDAADWYAHLHRQVQAAVLAGAGTVQVDSADRDTTLALRWQRPGDADAAATEAAIDTMSTQLTWWMLSWHEVITWLGYSRVPPFSERASAFSFEDGYSHLVGLQVGRRALRRAEPWNQAVTAELDATLGELGAASRNTTSLALERVKDQWWSSQRSWPANGFVMRRHVALGVDAPLLPWLVPGLPGCPDAAALGWQLPPLAPPAWQARASLSSAWGGLRRQVSWPPPGYVGGPEPASQRSVTLQLPHDLQAVLAVVETQMREELGPLATSPAPAVAPGAVAQAAPLR